MTAHICLVVDETVCLLCESQGFLTGVQSSSDHHTSCLNVNCGWDGKESVTAWSSLSTQLLQQRADTGVKVCMPKACGPSGKIRIIC